MFAVKALTIGIAADSYYRRHCVVQWVLGHLKSGVAGDMEPDSDWKMNPDHAMADHLVEGDRAAGSCAVDTVGGSFVAVAGSYVAADVGVVAVTVGDSYCWNVVAVDIVH
jgi:hypothetical protein